MAGENLSLNDFGWPMATIIRGNVVMRDGQLLGSALGKPMRFGDCLIGDG